MSGMVSRFSIVGFVYVEMTVGLKVQKGEGGDLERAERENDRKLAVLQQQVDHLADVLHDAILTAHAESQFEPIAAQYRLYQPGMTGFTQFPTRRFYDETQPGDDGYLLLHENPAVALRFHAFPGREETKAVQDLIARLVVEASGEGSLL
ncbi:hypothetical protein HCH_02256 [Hahella chejuensis KCTC 2396]|uniref:Uncharacterized protein n=1 Tax=Hahella chejuensis (strain KCTC 2396) TaxID=349521 RepID=Q2SJU3_HAHCH|nr:hypothetical protein [Hahella chejuensis]ABC29081.1 hypothetical protein HCH_02256 [Hahella chejuensis KCTC 2396]